MKFEALKISVIAGMFCEIGKIIELGELDGKKYLNAGFVKIAEETTEVNETTEVTEVTETIIPEAAVKKGK